MLKGHEMLKAAERMQEQGVTPQQLKLLREIAYACSQWIRIEDMMQRDLPVWGETIRKMLTDLEGTGYEP